MTNRSSASATSPPPPPGFGGRVAMAAGSWLVRGSGRAVDVRDSWHCQSKSYTSRDGRVSSAMRRNNCSSVTERAGADQTGRRRYLFASAASLIFPHQQRRSILGT